jgi:hypothetical protein
MRFWWVFLGLLVGISGCASPATTEIRDVSAAKRSTVITGTGAVIAGGTALGFLVASNVEQSAVKDGGFATGQDIAAAADRGQTYSEVSAVSGLIAGILAGATVALYFYSYGKTDGPKQGPPPTEPKTSSSGSKVRSFIEHGGFAF